MYGVDGERDLDEQILDHLQRLRRRPAGAHRQRRLRPATSTTCGARCSTRSTSTRKSRDRLDERLWPILKRQVEAALAHWREPDRGHLGGARRAEALHVVEADVLGRRRPRRPARPAARRARAGRDVAGGRRRDPRRHLRERRRRARRLHPALRHRRRSTPRCCSMPLVALPARRRPARAGHRPRHRRRADRRRARAALPGRRRPTTACPARRARSRSARSGWCRRSSRSARSSGPRQLCEKLLSFASPLGLYAEEIDPRSGRHLGNFPQAFTHLALINAVMHVIRGRGAPGAAAQSSAAAYARRDPSPRGRAATDLVGSIPQ